MKNAVLKVENLSKRYEEKEVLKKVSFSVFPGEVVGLVGANGSGKTTIFKTVCGLTTITEGNITVNGYSIKEKRTEALRYIRAMIETPMFYEHLSGLENLKMDARMYGVDEAETVNVIECMGLSESMCRPVRKYSLGMKQRLGIGRMLLGTPQLVLLDEPINGMDIEGIFEVREIIEGMRKNGTAVLISSHILTELEKVCDRVLFLVDGNVKELKRGEETLENAFRREILKGGKGETADTK